MSETQIQRPGSVPAIDAGPRGLQLATMEGMWWFAKRVCESGLAPKGLDRPEAALVAMQMGMELGLTPMASLQNVAVINGRPSLYGDVMPAICINSGKFDPSAFSETLTGLREGQVTDQTAAVCRVKRIDSQTVVERSFSVADAKLAGLWGKPGPWTQYPKRMLQMRARAFALRDAFPDVLRGFLSVEESRDIVTVEASSAGGVPGTAATTTAAERLARRLSLPADPAPRPAPRPAPAETVPAGAPAESAAPSPVDGPQTAGVPAEPEAEPSAEPELPPHERVCILLAEANDCEVGRATAALEAYCRKIYRKPLSSMTQRGLAEIMAKIRSGEMRIEPEPATT